jgi:hypothetical protein
VSDEKTSDALAPQTADYVAAAVRSVVGAAPFAGSLMAEVAGMVIPNQRVNRLVAFARELEARLSALEQGFVRSQISDETFTDLMEEGLRQAARSLSEERRQYIASLIANSLNPQGVSYIESKHLLRLLDELNDVEVIRLGSHNALYGHAQQAYWDTHRDVLEPVFAQMNSSQEEHDKATMQRAFDEHLAQLGLLRPIYKVDSKTKEPTFDRDGRQVVRSYDITALGRLLCRAIDLPDGLSS